MKISLVLTDFFLFNQEWPILCVERALELLDYAYADVYVRRYAVECLKTVK